MHPPGYYGNHTKHYIDMSSIPPSPSTSSPHHVVITWNVLQPHSYYTKLKDWQVLNAMLNYGYRFSL